jgi:uncharacterized cupredoxin-like copper-binding protein
MPRTRFTLAVLALVTLNACGGSDAAQGTSPSQEETAEQGGGEAGEGEFSFGTPADPTDAERTIEVRTSDELAFEPAEVSVQHGETVTFAVTNDGKLPHDFVLGDEATQEQHAQEMAASEEDMAHEGMEHGDANAISVPAGETVELTWTFGGDADRLLYGCHEPGHYEAGMVGTIIVES